MTEVLPFLVRIIVSTWVNTICAVFPLVGKLTHEQIFTFLGSPGTLQFHAGRIKIPPARYTCSAGSDKGLDLFGLYRLFLNAAAVSDTNACFYLHSRLSFTLRV